MTEFNCKMMKSPLYRYFAFHLDEQEEISKLKECLGKDFHKYKNVKIKDRSQELMKLLDKVFEKKHKMEVSYKLSKQLSSYTNILARLADAYLYLRIGNISRAETILKEIFNKELLYHTIRSDIGLMNLDKQISYTIRVLEKLQLHFDKNKYFEILLFYLYSQSGEEFAEKLSQEFNIGRGVKYARSQYGSFKYGASLPYTWGPVLFEEGSIVEYENYLASSMKFQSPSQADSLLFYRKTQLIRKELKSDILKKFKDLRSLNHYYDKFIYYRLLNDKEVYKFLSANINFKLGLVGNKERIFYKNRLRKNDNFKLSLYMLMALGDFDSKYINKAIAIEKRRLSTTM